MLRKTSTSQDTINEYLKQDMSSDNNSTMPLFSPLFSPLNISLIVLIGEYFGLFGQYLL